MLNTGDSVFDTTKRQIQFVEKIEAEGYVFYKAFKPATGRGYKANGEKYYVKVDTRV